MKIFAIILSVLLLSSCAFTSKLTSEQLDHTKWLKLNIDYELDKLWVDYSYKRDSLLLEYYEHK